MIAGYTNTKTQHILIEFDLTVYIYTLLALDVSV